MPEIRVCKPCGSYTMSQTCPKCGGQSSTAHPARFSPDDKYGKYRRISIEEEYGERGNIHGVSRETEIQGPDPS